MQTTLAAAGCAFLLASCTLPTPQARIQANPAMYNRLGDREQDLVAQGRVEKGMSPDAVYLAWGQASHVFEGSVKGKPVMRWEYNGSTPVYTSSFGMVAGYGHGPWGRYPYSMYQMGPEVSYVPYRRAYVEFENRRVTAWEKARQ